MRSGEIIGDDRSPGEGIGSKEEDSGKVASCVNVHDVDGEIYFDSCYVFENITTFSRYDRRDQLENPGTGIGGDLEKQLA